MFSELAVSHCPRPSLSLRALLPYASPSSLAIGTTTAETETLSSKCWHPMSIKYDPVTLLGFTTSLLAITSCVFTLITLSREWRRRADFARDVVDVHQREIEVLKRVMGECREIIETCSGSRLGLVGGAYGRVDGGRGVVEWGVEQGMGQSPASSAPESVRQALRMCEQREADLMRVMAMPGLGITSTSTTMDPVLGGLDGAGVVGGRGLWSWWAVNLRLPLLEKDLKRRYEMFKEDVLLLRALCSELRSQRQLLEVTAAIAKLVADYVEPESNGG